MRFERGCAEQFVGAASLDILDMLDVVGPLAQSGLALLAWLSKSTQGIGATLNQRRGGVC